MTDLAHIRKLAGIAAPILIETSAGLPRVNPPSPNFVVINIGEHHWYISYQTVVAYAGPKVPRGIRRDSNYSKTTAKQMNAAGVKDWKRVTDQEFEALASL